MSKFIWMILLAVVSSSVMAEWVEVGSTADLAYYADPTTIHKAGDMVKMWDMFNLKTVLKLGDASVMSIAGQSEYDCKEEQSRQIYYHMYKGSMGADGTVHSASTPKNEWEPLTPGSIPTALWKVACGKVDFSKKEVAKEAGVAGKDDEDYKQTKLEWENAITTFFQEVKVAEGLDYQSSENSNLFKAFDTEVKKLGNDKKYANKGYFFFLCEAHKKVMQQFYSSSYNPVKLSGICASPGLVAQVSPASNASPKLSSTGSGFVASTSGALLTNHHVANGCSYLKIRDSSKIEYDATVVATDARNDLALLQTSTGLSLPAATFRANSSVEAGENVVALGYPLAGVLASEVNVSFGYVSATAGLADDTSKLQISAPVQPGNSGGPLLDQAGNLIGVVVAKLDALKVAKAIGDIPQNINFAVKGEVAQVFLKAHKVKFKTATATKKLENTDIASRGRAFTVLVECYK